MAKKDTKMAKKDTVECIIQRDFWDEEGNRQPKGRVVEVSVEAALDGAENGTLKRVKGD